MPSNEIDLSRNRVELNLVIGMRPASYLRQKKP